MESAPERPAPADEPALPRPRSLADQELHLVSVLVVILGAGLFMALPFVLSAGAVVFLPFVAAVILSIVLAPLADSLTRLGLPNLLASLLAMAAMIATVILALLLILQPAAAMVDSLPQMMNRISQEFTSLKGNFAWVDDIDRQLARLSGRTPGREVVVATPTVIEQVAVATPSVVIETLLTLLMTFFLIESRVRMRQRLIANHGQGGTGVKAARVARDVQDRVASYILTIAVINMGVGVAVALGAWAIGLEAPIMWGGLAALFNFLPYIGPLLMLVVLTVVGLGTADTLLAGLLPAAAYLGLHTLEADLVTPSLLGARFTVHPVLILLSISYFSWIWGVVGALLSVPILITLTALFAHVGTPNLIGFLFGEPLFPDLPDEADTATTP